MADLALSILHPAIVILGFIAMTAGISSLFPRYGWLLDLVSQFRVQIGWLNVGVAVLSGLAGLAALALVCLLLGGLVLASLRPFWHQSGQDWEGRYRLILFNVRMRNRAFDRVRQYVMQQAPDLLGLVEVDQAWLEGLDPLKSIFPYQASFAHPASYGLALFSQHPIRSWRSSRLPGSDVDHLEIDLDLPDGKIRVILAHLPPPFSPSERKKRDDRLHALGEIAAATDGPTLILGDFNASPWTPSLQALETDLGMKSLRRLHGLLPTWPAQFGPARIPIDHVFGSDGTVAFGASKVGPDLGSDHLPIEVSLTVRG